MTQTQARPDVRSGTPKPPSGWTQLKWYGPGLMWMISSVGSGSVLFTPRVGSRYGYEYLWALLIVILFMWVMIREVGRYTVVTGKTILDGYRDLPGPKNWAIWLIFLPQVVAAVVTIAGIAALVGSALMLALPGNQAVYAVAIILLSSVLVVSGRYSKVEKATSVMAGVLILAVGAAAIQVFPGVGEIAGGLVPGIGDDFDIEFLLPWLGFILAGAAGIMWFSYWVAAREYGGPVEDSAGADQPPDNLGDYDNDEDFQQRRRDRLQRWMRVMSTTAIVGVVGGGLVIVAFMVLGAELLQPEGIVPEGIAVAEDLTRLLSEVWGEFGYWLLLVSIVIALGGTIVANQDGWPRTFADATLILAGDRLNPEPSPEGHRDERLQWRRWLGDRDNMKNFYVIVTVTVLPLVVFFVVRDPVDILEVGGIVAAIHTPVIVGLTLYLNKTKLPEDLQPGWLATPIMVLSGLFFTAVAVLYFMIERFGMDL
ncbi:Nramp family divalent metal transporter [Leptolyngbya sp. KIOST-1]|uniref:Nramp family divalent metal transporter n=1 Tax=Leptolyngbya sp. KIOST-1 TaxID=1229172 RepID=UPI000568A5D5|nr:Nramp family divalent metal transporter [Leptolyngbya sp. KIOST-1]